MKIAKDFFLIFFFTNFFFSSSVFKQQENSPTKFQQINSQKNNSLYNLSQRKLEDSTPLLNEEQTKEVIENVEKDEELNVEDIPIENDPEAQENKEYLIQKEDLFKRIHLEFDKFAKNIKNCIDSIDDLIYSKKEVEKCTRKDLFELYTFTQYQSSIIKAFFDEYIRQTIKKACVQGIDLIEQKPVETQEQEKAKKDQISGLNESCDKIQVDSLDLLWAELNFYEIIKFHEAKYQTDAQIIPMETFQQIKRKFDSLYRDQAEIFEEMSINNQLIEVNSKLIIDSKTKKVEEYVKFVKENQEPIKVTSKIRIHQAVRGYDTSQEIHLENLPRLIPIDSTGNMFPEEGKPILYDFREHLGQDELKKQTISLEIPEIGTKQYKTYLKGTSDLISPVDQKKVIVLDIGSTFLRLGLSGDNMPILNIPLVVAKSKHKNSSDLTQTKLPDVYGKKAVKVFEEKQEEYNLVYPLIEFENINERITEIEAFFKYVFEDMLKIETSILELLIIDNINMGIEFRVKLMEMFFEQMRVQSINFIYSAVASLFLSGRTTGLSLEFGNLNSNIVPVFEGYILQHATFKSPYGGYNATKIIQEYLTEVEKIDFRQKKLDSIQIIQKIKEKISFVSNDYENDIKQEKEFDIEETCYELPDGTIVKLSNEIKFKSGEVILKPGILIKDEEDIVKKLFVSFMNCDQNLQEVLVRNVLVSGGASLTNNLVQRLQNDLRQQMPKDCFCSQVNVIGENHRPLSSWIGGSILGSIVCFQNLKIKKDEYEGSTEPRVNFLFKKIV